MLRLGVRLSSYLASAMNLRLQHFMHAAVLKETETSRHAWI